MLIPFAKLHGAGNAYLAMDGRMQPPSFDWPALARAMAAQHTGVGSDGLVVAQAARGPEAVIRMRVFNSDGSEAEMSGNGVRLFAKFVLDRGLVGSEADGGLRVETEAGLRIVWPRFDGGLMCAGRVAMGIPRIEGEQTLDLPSGPLTVTILSLGNPHAVHLTDRPVSGFPLAAVGSEVQRHPRFPKQVNFEVANVLARDRLRARVFERGEGETPSSGTGSTACAVAARVAGRSSPEVEVELPGGVLQVAWEGEGEQAWLDGPTVEVFRGTWSGGWTVLVRNTSHL
ncbi:MAG: diaminopimelate epimerase [bacterium]|nr:diaminopimelate epimerase [bacterium]